MVLSVTIQTVFTSSQVCIKQLKYFFGVCIFGGSERELYMVRGYVDHICIQLNIYSFVMPIELTYLFIQIKNL